MHKQNRKNVGQQQQQQLLTINFECVEHFNISGRLLAEHGERVQEVLKRQIALAIAWECLACEWAWRSSRALPKIQTYTQRQTYIYIERVYRESKRFAYEYEACCPLPLSLSLSHCYCTHRYAGERDSHATRASSQCIRVEPWHLRHDPRSFGVAPNPDAAHESVYARCVAERERERRTWVKALSERVCECVCCWVP